MPTSPETNSGCVARHLDRVRVHKSDRARSCPLIGYSARIAPDCYVACHRAVARSNRADPRRSANSQRRAPASHALLPIGAVRDSGDAPARGRVGRTDVTNRNRSRCSALRRQLGRRSRFKHGSALDVRDGKDYILGLTRSERLKTEGPLGRSADCRLPEGKSKRARLGGLSAFWGWL
jgi:hypothetical protein